MHSSPPVANTNRYAPQRAHGPLRHSDSRDFGIYALEASPNQPEGMSPRWLVVDHSGRIVARAHSELLAIAKMQILRLADLVAPSASSMPDAPRR